MLYSGPKKNLGWKHFVACYVAPLMFSMRLHSVRTKKWRQELQAGYGM
jgi:NRPS condensation-like uncharacterized protein